MINNENTRTLSDLLFNEITFENISYDNKSIDINNNNYNISERENYFLLSLQEDVYQNLIDENSENSTWRIDYLSFIESIINKIEK